MRPKRQRDFRLDLWGVVLMALFLVVPVASHSPLAYSLTHQIVIGISAALSVYIMLRMDLLNFTVPAFMAVGGYTTAMLATSAHITSLPVLLLASFVVPMILAVPLGAIVLKLKGTYFVFITFIVNEIVQLAIFETPDLTGGSNGIPAVPAASLFGVDMGKPGLLVYVTIIIGLVAAAVTVVVTQRYRAEFSAIEENPTLAESLGVAIHRYRNIGFIVSSGVAGLAGFALVNQLSTAHPSSFSSMSAVNYIAYAFIGGRGTVLGPVIGGAILIFMSNVFSSQGMYASALFGALLITGVMIAPDGLIGLVRRIMAKLRSRNPGMKS